MPDAAQLAQDHWNETPLFLTEKERYSIYPWLCEVAEFRKHAGERVLEIGCGTGSDLLQFAKHGAVATGVDITERHLEMARERVGGLAAIQRADMRSLPFEDGAFDYVYCHGVLMYSDEPKKAVREIYRVLRPGGRFNVHVYAFWSYFTLWRFLRYGTNLKVHLGNSTAPVHVDLYTARKLRKLFDPGISIEKHQCKPFESLAPLFGWFMVAKGQKT
ncbi:MAG: methyltransferase domain-containing protein [Acidobacteriaceae bacterium]